MCVNIIRTVSRFAVSIGIHLVGDYALQIATSSFIHKKSSVLHLAAHSAMADGTTFAFIGACIGGWKGAVIGAVAGTLAHMAVDSLGIRGSVALKLLDQSLHIGLAVVFAAAYSYIRRG